MAFQKIKAPSLTDLFVQQIENKILSGELEVGEQLPPARELAVRMGVSRPVISAGLVELEKLGFVEIHPRRGVFVSDYRRKGSLETLVAIMRYNGGAMRSKEVRSLFETRLAMESLCIRLIIERAADEEIRSLEPILEDLAAAKNEDEAANHIFRFHHEMAVISGNVLLPLLYYAFGPHGVYLWGMGCKHNGIPFVYENKKKLYDALLSRDLPVALAQTEQILEKATDDIAVYDSTALSHKS